MYLRVTVVKKSTTHARGGPYRRGRRAGCGAGSRVLVSPLVPLVRIRGPPRVWEVLTANLALSSLALLIIARAAHNPMSCRFEAAPAIAMLVLSYITSTPNSVPCIPASIMTICILANLIGPICTLHLESSATSGATLLSTRLRPTITIHHEPVIGQTRSARYEYA